MAARYTLHGIWLSGPTYKVGLFLSLAGEPFDYVQVNLREGEHKRPEYLAKQRFGQVPLIDDNSNGRHLCQSASILEYLADKTGKFGGATLEQRIEAREWVFWGWDRLTRGIYRTRAAKLGFANFPAEVLAHYEAEGQAALKISTSISRAAVSSSAMRRPSPMSISTAWWPMRRGPGSTWTATQTCRPG